MNSWGNVVYDEYVRPIEHIVDFRTKISGIRPRNMRKGLCLTIMSVCIAVLEVDETVIR